MWRKLVIFLQLWMSVYPVEDTLRMVHVVLRHCERTPDESELYHHRIYYNETVYAPYGYGQLTNVGKRECYEMGKRLRKRYDGFLNSSYHYSIIEGRSSHFVRAKETLQLVLAGLFPPTPELKWSTDLNWIPIATYFEEKEKDMIECPYVTERFVELFLEFEETEEMKLFRAPYENFRRYVSQRLQANLTFRDLAYVVSGLKTIDELGQDLPFWTESIYPNLTEPYLNHYIASYFIKDEFRRMLCGYFLRKIIDDTESKINGTSDKQMVIHSTHDVTIITLFEILSIWNKTHPATGSYCTWEVHQINGTYGFKLYYSENATNEPYLLYMPGYGEFLPFDQLKMIKRDHFYLDDIELSETSHSTKIGANLIISFFTLYVVLRL